VGPLSVDRRTHAVDLGGEPLRVTPTEFRLLDLLMEHPGRVVAYATITAQLWGDDGHGALQAARVALHRLRRKLERRGACPQLVRTVPGLGVMMGFDIGEMVRESL
jgi:two-component system, OmpR family, KDP operon response regulator KdpE